MHRTVLPEGWPRPKGYANAILAPKGRVLFLAGQVGWDPLTEEFASDQIAPQFEQALKNILALVNAAGGKTEDVCKITAFCCNREAYLAARPQLGRIWKEQMGHHYPCMSMIFVSDLLDHPGQIELEATAVIPD